MLVNARELLYSNHENCEKLSENIYEYALKTNNQEIADYSLLFILKSNFYQRNYELVIKDIGKLRSNAIKHNNLEILCDAHLLKAITLSNLNDFNGAVNEIQEVANIVNKMPNQNSRIIYTGLMHQNQAIIYYNNHSGREVVLRYLKLALYQFKKIQVLPETGFVMYPKNDLLRANYDFIANEYVALKMTDSAKYYLAKTLATKARYPDPRRTVMTYNNYGYISYLEKNYLDALKFYSKSEAVAKTSDDSRLLHGAYEGLSIVHNKLGNFKEANHYMYLKVAIDEQNRIISQKSVANSLDDIFDEKNKTINEKNKQLSNLQIVLGIGGLLGGLSLILLFREFKKQKTTKKQLQFLVNQKLNRVSSRKNNSKGVDLEKLVELAIQNDAAFYPKFRESNRDFISKLITLAPSINTSELKLAAYLKLDFSAKEIAQYTKTTVRSVEAKKYRLRKRLNIPTDQDIHLWLSQL
ncbi:hypothetical protein GV828_12685 [Flavobacterium sp. NST-5]|uniref:HTH luxR-type domain-containing protein n=1 Tax=Flavobacterium ichthyis TaxID=2698827 RepID=A0ABW9ZBF6_9FLAO|nr:hypothetical protein [Flavobacterium ichthyis]NBL66054.1 hypothetical protein [Flavobacterium ichthyis]